MAITRDVVEVPEIREVPTTAVSRPYGNTDALVDELAQLGYEEHEYFASGVADGAPYTIRLLVRRPRDPAAFSGVVIAEAIRNTGHRSMWALSEHIVRRGHAYVEIGANARAIRVALVPSDPERYAQLQLADPPFFRLGGYSIPAIAQCAAALRSGSARVLLPGLAVTNMILAGYSQQGIAVRLFMGHGHHQLRRGGGESVFDGYFPTGAGDFPPLDPFGDPIGDNHSAPPVDVPTLFVVGENEVAGEGRAHGFVYRRPDADDAGDRFRLWEITGMGHGDGRSVPPPASFAHLPNPYPWQHAMRNALDKLVGWVVDGTPPPSAEPIATDAEGEIVTDEHGIARGGVRSVFADVPRGRYVYTPGFGPGGYEPFDADELQRRYPHADDYEREVHARAGELVARGYLLQESADELLASG